MEIREVKEIREFRVFRLYPFFSKLFNLSRHPEERSLFFLVIPRSGATWGSLRLAKAFDKGEINFAVGEIATAFARPRNDGFYLLVIPREGKGV